MTQFIRYQPFDQPAAGVSHGILEGSTIREIRQDPLSAPPLETGVRRQAADVKLLCPVTPTKILCVGLNYKSHIGTRTTPTSPEIFYKPVSSLQSSGEPIVIPRDATNVHYEGELVVVIGRRARNVGRDEAAAAIFGVTCGNDVSEREWQHGSQKDLQWWRAKGSDTFAPLGPVLAAGIDYGNLLLQTRLNGEIVQKQYTSDLLFDCPTIVSYISQWVTLEPGDVIYTGTPGATRKMNPGDVVEVDIEGIGILRNPIATA